MSRPFRPSASVLVTVGALLLASAAACSEDGKSLPDRCEEPLPLFDPYNTDADDGVASNPCVTEIGHAVSFVGNPPSSSGGKTSQGGAPSAAGDSAGGDSSAGEGGAGN